MLGKHQSTRVKIPVFQPFGYLPVPASALFVGLGRFPYPEHRRWGRNLRDYTGWVIPAWQVLVQLSSGRFVDLGTSFEECGGLA